MKKILLLIFLVLIPIITTNINTLNTSFEINPAVNNSYYNINYCN